MTERRAVLFFFHVAVSCVETGINVRTAPYSASIAGADAENATIVASVSRASQPKGLIHRMAVEGPTQLLTWDARGMQLFYRNLRPQHPQMCLGLDADTFHNGNQYNIFSLDRHRFQVIFAGYDELQVKSGT